jgi:hypothetical protein
VDSDQGGLGRKPGREKEGDMPALIPALVIGAGTVAGAAISGGAADNAAHTAANTAAENNALQSQIYGSNKALAQPYVDAGDHAETALNGFLGLGGDPAATQKAFNDYLGSTGYQFNLNQGLGAVNQSKAAAGLLGSGSTLKALDAYGTGLADQYGQQYVGNLQNEVSTGQNAVNGLTGAGQSYANAVSSNNNTAAATAASAGLAGASNTNALIGNALSAYGALRGQSSFGGGGAAYSNAFSQPGYAAFGG